MYVAQRRAVVTAAACAVLLGLAGGAGAAAAEAGVERHDMPAAAGRVAGSLFTRAGQGFAAVLVDDPENSSLWNVVRKRGDGYERTIFTRPVWSLRLSPDGSRLAIVQGGREESLVLFGSRGGIAWTRPVSGADEIGFSADGSVVFTWTRGEHGPGRVHLYGVERGVLLGTITEPAGLAGVIVDSPSQLILASPVAVWMLRDGVPAWSLPLPGERVIGLRDLDGDCFAVLEAKGRCRVQRRDGTFVFGYDPVTLAEGGAGPTAGYLRKLSPFGVGPGRVIFFDVLEASPTVVDVDLATGSLSSRVAYETPPPGYRPGHRLEDGRLGWVKEASVVYLDLRPHARTVR